MTGIGSTYAQALYSLASDEGMSLQILEEMDALSKIFASEPAYLRLLSAASLSKQERISLVDESLKGRVAPYLLNFVKILVEKGYIRHFSACLDAYKAQYNADNGILPVKAVTAVPLSEEQKERLIAKLAGITGKQIELQNEVDPACLGGVRLDYDGMRVDGTVARRLDAVRDLLKNTVL